MKLISWNVNGLRAVVRKDKWDQVFDMEPDILCIQETKASPDQLPEENHAPQGYTAVFASSTARKGYSGVATFARQSPAQTTVGLGKDLFDHHGRVVTHVFEKHVVVNAYFPNGSSKTAPLDMKLAFYETFIEHINTYRDKGYSVIFGGDLNVAHEAIDLARPESNKNNIGFLPEERAWIDAMEENGYTDTFRHLHPEKAQYSYWDLRTRARERNVGWRLDYWFVSDDLLPFIEKAYIEENIYGSDHAPVVLELGKESL